MPRIRSTALLGLALVFTAVFCVKPTLGQVGEKASDKKEQAAEAKDSQAPEDEEVDPFEVPEGTPEELLEYIAKVRQHRPRVRTFQEYAESQQKLNGALLTAAERILAAEPEKDLAEQAVDTKLAALSALVRFDKSDEIVAKLEAMPEELKKIGMEHLVRKAQRAIFSMKVSALRGAGTDGAGQLVGEVIAFIEEGDRSADDFGLAMAMAQTLEHGDDVDRAAKTFRHLAKLFMEAEDERIAEYAVRLEGAARRIQLPGNEMPLEGMTLDGEKLDWSKYEGKVVLVDFWATWCGPCLAEIPNIEKNYEAYHDRGFDVISISTDKTREPLEKFLEKHDHPWLVLWDPAAKEAEDMKSMSVHYGVFGIPTFVLIGADGKVVALNPRGKQLGEELAKLLGPPPEEEKDEE